MNESHNNERLNYEAPETTRTQVKLETPIMAASKDKVVKDDNTTVEIEEHKHGGDFTLENWNE